MAANKYTDKTKTFTRDELNSEGLLDCNLQFREIHPEDGQFKFVGYRDDLNRHFPDFRLIDAGIVHGHEMVHKFGRIPEATLGVWSTIWDGGGMIPFTGVNLVSPTLVSTAADTTTINVKGVKLVGQDWVPVSYDVVLTGLTPVALPGDIMAAYRMTNIGSTTLAGDVTLDAEGVTYAKIIDSGNNYNTTQMAFFTVPTGYIALVTKFGGAIAAGKEAQIAARYTPFGQISQVAMIFDLVAEKFEMEVFYSFDEKSILQVDCKPVGNNSDVSAFFDIILIEKTEFEILYGGFKEHGSLS